MTEEIETEVTGEIVGRVIRQEGDTTVIELAEFPPPMLVKMKMDRILALPAAAGFVEVGIEDGVDD